MPRPAARPHEAARLAALRDYEILDTKAERAFDRLVQAAAALTGCPVALVSFVDSDRQWFKARHGFDRPETGRDHAFCAHATAGATRPLVVPDTTQDPRFADHPLVLQPPPIRFYAGVPLLNPEGQALGTLCVLDHAPRHMPAAQLATLVGLAGVACNLLEIRRAARLRRAA